jgi:hypothetical protein
MRTSSMSTSPKIPPAKIRGLIRYMSRISDRDINLSVVLKFRNTTRMKGRLRQTIKMGWVNDRG